MIKLSTEGLIKSQLIWCPVEQSKSGSFSTNNVLGDCCNHLSWGLLGSGTRGTYLCRSMEVSEGWDWFPRVENHVSWWRLLKCLGIPTWLDIRYKEWMNWISCSSKEASIRSKPLNPKINCKTWSLVNKCGLLDLSTLQISNALILFSSQHANHHISTPIIDEFI